MSLYRKHNTSGVMYGRIRPLALEIEISEQRVLDQDVLKAHCAVDGDALDDLLALYELVAVQWAEDEMHRTILARSHSFVISDFPRCQSSQQITLPRGLCQAIQGIQYVSGGEIVSLYGSSAGSPGGSDYQEDLRSENGARILPAQSTSWPSVDIDAVNPVVINYTAGWLSAAQVPAKIKHALMFAVADMLEIRGTTDLSSLMAIAASGKTFDARTALISRYIINRVY